jgi:hypothetical protein
MRSGAVRAADARRDGVTREQYDAAQRFVDLAW